MSRSFFSFAAAIFAVSAVPSFAEEVEIYLPDLLDNTQSGYCVDIAGGKGASANPANGLQGHTCYSPLGELLVDQIFETDCFADGQLYMPKFDVCAQITGPEPGASIELSACTGAEQQSFRFSGDGEINPVSAPTLCVTVGEDTRFGRSPTNQIKTLTLETCDAVASARQMWSTRTGIE